MTIKWKIILLPVIAVVGTVLLIYIVGLINKKIEQSVVMPRVSAEIINSEKSKIKSLIQAEADVAADIVRKNKDKGDDAVRLALIEHTDNVSFFDDGQGYFFIYDFDGNRINSPGTKGEAKTSGDFSNAKDSKGNVFIMDLAEAAKKGGGFVEYWFPKKGETEPNPKVSYSARIEGTNYFIGTGVYFDQIYAYTSKMSDIIAKETSALMVYIYIATAVYIIILAVLALLIIRGIIIGLNGVKGELLQIVETGDTSAELDDSLVRRKDEIGQLASAGRKIIADFEKVATTARSLAERDWQQDVVAKSDKDIMNKSLASMINQVNETLIEVSNLINELDTGVRQVSIASNALSEGATTQAASIEEISASLIEMSGRTNQTAQNATEANSLAQFANTAAVSGQEQMQTLAEAIGDITVRAEETKKVVKTIDDIAFQTNLLALNAAVEAARAGVHGKGFAIVAEEVRNLAARSAKAAGETAELIDNVVSEVKIGNSMAESTAESFNKIVEQISKAAVLVGEIAEASSNQAQGVSQINQGIEQIDAVTQENTASAEETAAASTHMSNLATKLNDVISMFKLKSGNEVEVVKKRRRKPVKPVRNALTPPTSDSAVFVRPDEQIKLDDSEFGKF